MDSPTPALTPELLPPKEKPSLFVWALKIIGVVVAGLLLAKIWQFANSPLANKIFTTMADQRRLLLEETSAPGTTELRKHGPCAQATVASPDLRRRMDKLSGRRARRKETPPDETLVSCMAPMLATAPSCEALAQVYVDAAHPTGPFRIVVNQPPKPKGCVADYDSSGTPLDIDAGAETR